jgi:hypothetical protein
MYPLGMELLCTYAHFKFRQFNTHPMMSRFFTNKPSHISNDIAGQVIGERVVGGFICKKKRAPLDEYCMIQI